MAVYMSFQGEDLAAGGELPVELRLVVDWSASAESRRHQHHPPHQADLSPPQPFFFPFKPAVVHQELCIVMEMSVLRKSRLSTTLPGLVLGYANMLAWRFKLVYSCYMSSAARPQMFASDR